MTCNWCNIVFSHKCLTYTNQTFYTMNFNRKLIKFFEGNISKLRGHVCSQVAQTHGHVCSQVTQTHVTREGCNVIYIP